MATSKLFAAPVYGRLSVQQIPGSNQFHNKETGLVYSADQIDRVSQRDPEGYTYVTTTVKPNQIALNDPASAGLAEIKYDSEGSIYRPTTLYDDVWGELAQAQGITPIKTITTGAGEDATSISFINPDFVNYVKEQKATGLDVSVKGTPGRRYYYDVAITQNGQPVNEPKSIKYGQSTWSTFTEAVRDLSPIITTVLTAGFGAPLGAALGAPAGSAAASALGGAAIGGGVAAFGGGDIGDIAKSALLGAAGGYAKNALVGDATGGAGIAEGMDPSVVTPATPAELAAVNALVVPTAATNALTTGAQSYPVADVSIPTQSYPVTDIPVTTPPYGRLPTTDLYADLAGAAAAPPVLPAPVVPPTVGGADLYADLAGAAAVPPVVPPTVGGADLYADLAGAAAVPPVVPPTVGGADLYADLAGAAAVPPVVPPTVGGADMYADLAAAAAPAASTAANVAKAAMDTSSIWGPLITSLASLYGGSQAAQASERAADITAAATNRAIDLQERMYREGMARQQPFYEAGVNALTQLQQRTGAMPPAFTGQVDLTRDPGYAFRLSEGLKGLERSAAARGGLMSGATGKALTRYGQEAASQEYQNAYNRALTEYNALRQREAEEYNRLSGLAGVGGTTAQQLGVAGQQMASNVGNLATQQGSTAANALLSGAAARQSAYGDVGKAWGQYFAPQPMINYLGGRPYGG